ncbi:restriction endonuclease [Aerophototrophica crusticola]|uniref:Restriction endonuclease n=1 Tax=Aerophototrophica crusticola TaxID=1709002 RepID=A0A858RBC2_9PROT|nr:restriction endonuclease [Rhodospirillaceae bacterium B3]
MKAVFTTKVDPTYDDLPEFQYHFPRTYLRQAQAAVGDWIIYYEPRRSTGDRSSRGGRQAYFATARVMGIRPDPTLPDHFYAFVEGYLPLVRPVPFREGSHYYERGLRRDDGETNKGAFGRAVRLLTEQEYADILQAGMAHILTPEPPTAPVGQTPFGFADEPATFERPIIERLVARPVRDAAFAAAVKEAYHDTCAITGLRLINGGGRAEVQAAHIRPVAEHGPDSPRNGLALSATVHWMFDRGLVSATDDCRLLVAERHVPEPARRLFLPDGKLQLPDRPDLRPHPQFLRWHRERVFKG